MMKKVTIFFDLERATSVQGERNFDLKRNIDRILKILRNYDVCAVFNVCGAIVENNPKIISKLDDNDYEIASHGYSHENFVLAEKNGELSGILERTEDAIKKTIGKKPVGVRSPWYFCNRMVYSVFEKRGYKWASNQTIFRTELLKRPSNQSLSSLSSTAQKGFPLVKKAWFGLLWKKYIKSPFKVGNVMEIPLLSSDDGELLGQISPSQKTPESILDFAQNCLIEQFEKSQDYFNMNFHPWIIGSGNRPELLDRTLSYIIEKDVEFILPKNVYG